jgi:DNA-binding NarL/FixJ family response regulator
VIEADNASEGNELLKKDGPDVVLLDLRMPEVDGSTMFDVINMFHRKAKVIVNSVFPIEEQKRLVSGADAYNDKAEGIEALLEKVRQVAGE